ncbi:hypothetical protein OIDMADRAFT_62229 [Oidiodendron maius Zn]|uniref:Protein kinase domain-containing protein n=1 Tax=Oidiodendron maius (strain Zn) TaxID=913774 RepID=A0A0C3GQH3_OIDMZ|nr:hypothetical protein OIDMADRAFT_62229 [Oidiodendron maius Zn]
MSDNSLQTLRFIHSLPKHKRHPLQDKFKNADPLAIGLREDMLVFDPRKRVKASEGLAHEYLSLYCTTTRQMSPSQKRNFTGH